MTRQHKTPADTKREGSALVMALFVIMIISMLVGSFGFEAHLEAKYASYARDRVKATQLAQSGVVLAEMLMNKSGGGGGASAPDSQDRWFDATERLRLGQSLEGLVEEVGAGYVILDIVPEPGRLNVNLLTMEDWETLLGNIGIPEEYHQSIIEPILDWIEPGETPRVKGAKTDDYYSRLDPPYKIKGGPLDTVRELLLVKGFSESILTGGVFDPLSVEGESSLGPSVKVKSVSFDDKDSVIYISGIEHMLTTYGDGKINIQSAPYDVLRTLPGIDEILAYAIMEEREAVLNDEPNPFRSVQDLFSRIDGLDASIANRITVRSQYYRVTATGRVGRVERRINCIAYHNGQTLRFLRWWEEP